MSASASQLERERAPRLGPERRRPLVLDIAFELFLRHGYRGTSMDAIARAAGVSKPVIYDCFASKAELFGALLDREEQRMLAQLGDALASSARSEDLPGMFAAGFTAMLRAVGETPELYRIALLDAGDLDARIEARVRHGRAQQVQAIAALARVWLGGRLPEQARDAAALLAGEALVALGEAGVRTMLAAPQLWTPELLGELIARLAAAGFAALLDGGGGQRPAADAPSAKPRRVPAPVGGRTARARPSSRPVRGQTA